MIDGQAGKTFAANTMYIGIELPAGSHTIDLQYIPRSERRGLLMAGISVLILLTAGGLSRKWQAAGKLVKRTTE